MATSSVAFYQGMLAQFGPERVRTEAILAPYTTFKVGGPAEWFFEARTSAEIISALRLAHSNGVAVTLLGGGSNVLVGDRGVRGLVIRPRSGVIEQIDGELDRFVRIVARAGDARGSR